LRDLSIAAKIGRGTKLTGVRFPYRTKGQILNNKLLSLIILSTLLLSACGSMGKNPLNGTSWRLTSLGNMGLVPGAHITLAFKDGQVSGNSGCNSYGGEYQVKGDQIKFKQMVSTLMACADPAMMEQESLFLQFMGDAQGFELTDRQLQIFRSDGEALIFVPAE
jgi:heat shock protein HslJ